MVTGGELVKTWRTKKARITQEVLASVLETTQTVVADIEKNKTISIKNAKKLAPLIGVKFGYFFGEE